MEVVSGDLPAKKNYTLGGGRLRSPLGMKKWPLNKKTVASVELVSDRFLNSVTPTRALFGVGEALADVGTMGLSAKGQQTTLFKIDFTDGTTVTCHGTAQEYKKVLKFSSK